MVRIDKFQQCQSSANKLKNLQEISTRNLKNLTSWFDTAFDKDSMTGVTHQTGSNATD